MKVTNHLYAQAIRFGDISSHQGLAIYGRHLVRALEGRYGFVEVPMKADEFVLEKGISFLHGYFENRIVIDKLRIYNNGIIVETSSTTDDCESIIEDIIAWSPQALGISFSENKNLPRMFGSHIEAKFDVDLGKKFNGFRELSSMVTKAMTSYRDSDRDFRIAGFDLRIDPSTNGPGSFKIEARANKPYHDNLYFCAAPLRTSDHTHILAQFERLFGE
jgi:hypothetical protein